MTKCKECGAVPNEEWVKGHLKPGFHAEYRHREGGHDLLIIKDQEKDHKKGK